MDRFRIEFQIQQYDAEGDDWNEIGFGSSGSWDDLESAVHIVNSMVQNQEWETEHWQPDAASVGTATRSTTGLRRGSEPSDVPLRGAS